jgi:hypothetical protein
VHTVVIAMFQCSVRNDEWFVNGLPASAVRRFREFCPLRGQVLADLRMVNVHLQSVTADVVTDLHFTAQVPY